jgi:3-oxoacyl-[acyl-carrier protein] reductase
MKGATMGATATSPAEKTTDAGVTGGAADRYGQLMRTPIVGGIAKRAGLPRPPALERYRPGAPVIDGGVLIGAAPGARLAAALGSSAAECGASVAARAEDPARGAMQDVGILPAGVASNGADTGAARMKALVFDASGIADSTQLVELHRFFHPSLAALERNGRVLVVGRPPAEGANAREQTAQRALEGFVRALGKEVGRRGATAQLVYVADGAEGALGSTIRFLLSPRSAYVSGQVISLQPPAAAGAQALAAIDWDAPLTGRTALVTGASRGIGAAIAETLARDGARVVGLDVAAAQSDLRALMERLRGDAIELDITDAQAPSTIAEHMHDGVDVLVHNAGVTRDRTLAKMPEERWSTLLDINLSSEERINDELLARGLLRPNGRIVCVSSIAGIAGNAGQTNYSTAKAGVIGMVQALAPTLSREHGATINAVAPGFIETQMTAAMPFAVREAGRRMNSLLQGGLAVDVAETIAWLASPGSGAVNGNVVRVCGQSLLGA